MESLILERLKKFTRLANNNPNEHEANVAARRVCKILEEHNFELAVTWNDVKRSTEPAFKSTRTTSPTSRTSHAGTPYGPRFWEDVIFTYDKSDPNYKPPYDKSDVYSAKWYKEKAENDKAQRTAHRTKRTLACSICKIEQDTFFMGDPGTFRCWGCWYAK